MAGGPVRRGCVDRGRLTDARHRSHVRGHHVGFFLFPRGARNDVVVRRAASHVTAAGHLRTKRSNASPPRPVGGRGCPPRIGWREHRRLGSRGVPRLAARLRTCVLEQLYLGEGARGGGGEEGGGGWGMGGGGGGRAPGFHQPVSSCRRSRRLWQSRTSATADVEQRSYHPRSGVHVHAFFRATATLLRDSRRLVRISRCISRLAAATSWILSVCRRLPGFQSGGSPPRGGFPRDVGRRRPQTPAPAESHANAAAAGGFSARRCIVGGAVREHLPARKLAGPLDR